MPHILKTVVLESPAAQEKDPPLMVAAEDHRRKTRSDYIVFARKYRPQTLTDVVGQETLVDALQKAIACNQLSHAIVLHGIRGVGKTTTARIIAKGLNCDKGPTVDPCGLCSSCTSINEDRHLDVIEMDAASHTGVEDIREIIETAKYKAVQGRFKIYIIDEVHMLSKSAFNALLKTLEEPPPFVKFIFATTELQKVPETILSRCMRFDLKRIDTKTMVDRMMAITHLEELTIEQDAATLMARAAEGSMRDALSLLDQAVILSKDTVIRTHIVQEMLGLSSKDQIFCLLKSVFSGDVLGILTLTDDLYHKGSDAILLLKDILDALYSMICVKINPSLLEKGIFTETEKTSLQGNCSSLTLPNLMQVWQILNDRYDKVYKASVPSQALQMTLMQVCYVAHLPPLSDILSGGMSYPTLSSSPSSNALDSPPVPLPSPPASSVPPAESLPFFPTFEALVAFVKEKREPLLYTHLCCDVGVASYGMGCIGLHLKPNAPKNFITQLKNFLDHATHTSWVIEDKGPSLTALSLKEQEDKAYQALAQSSLDHPLVKEMLEEFPGAKASVIKEEQ